MPSPFVAPQPDVSGDFVGDHRNLSSFHASRHDMIFRYLQGQFAPPYQVPTDTEQPHIERNRHVTRLGRPGSTIKRKKSLTALSLTPTHSPKGARAIKRKRLALRG
jgi:hypothetical protein